MFERNRNIVYEMISKTATPTRLNLAGVSKP
jgi:hypothetical protein